jgi:hypothetical protein
MLKHKPKFCKNCQAEFRQFKSTDKYCSPKCQLVDTKVEEIKDKLKDHAYWIKKLQTVFNEFIRLRDSDLPCISCGTTKKGITYHAGHFMSVGAYPNLRFNEDNVHRQCGFNCNTSKHGNTAMYANNLMVRIGLERFDKLFEDKDKPLKLSIPEIQEKIAHYKQRIKELKEQNHANNNVGTNIYDVVNPHLLKNIK